MKNEKILGGPSPTEGASAGSSAPDAASHAAPTPGPWFVNVVEQFDSDNRPFGSIAYIKADTGHKEIAVIYGDDDQKANAHLIAAAPELLEYARLEEAIADFDCPHDADERCRCGRTIDLMVARAHKMRIAAIAKAEGRS